MNREQLQQIATQSELMFKMYGERQHYIAWRQAAEMLAASAPPAPVVKEKKVRGPSPLKGKKRNLSPEALAKMKAPRTPAQMEGLKKGWYAPSKNTGKWIRTPEWRAAARQRRLDQGEIKRGDQRGTKHPMYTTYIFAAVHPVYGMFYGDRLELHKRFPKDLPMGELRKLALGEYASYKGWRVIQKTPKTKRQTK